MNFIVQQTKSTPYVDFTDGNLIIKGNSFPTNSKDCYSDLIQCIETYSENPLPKTVVKIDIEIINCLTKRFILRTLRQLEKIKNQTHTITINWIYEEYDDDMLELGYIFQSFTELPFNFVPKIKNRK
jgi:hypothetical protein